MTDWVVSGGVVVLLAFVTKAIKDINSKVERNYKRLDEVKEKQDSSYTRKEVCEVLHTQLNRDITEIKADVKLLLRRNGISQ